MAETENKYVKLISDEAKQKIIDASVQNLSARPTSNATEMKKRFVMPIVNKEDVPSLADEVDRVADETNTALVNLNEELEGESGVNKRLDDAETDIETLQGNVSELSENDAEQSTRLETVEGKAEANANSISTAESNIAALQETTSKDLGAVLSIDYDNSAYKLTVKLLNKEGATLGEAFEIDLPLESVVVSGEYLPTIKTLVLTLQNGNIINIPLGDIIDGLISSSEKGRPDGVATLNSNGEIPQEQIPDLDYVEKTGDTMSGTLYIKDDDLTEVSVSSDGISFNMDGTSGKRSGFNRESIYLYQSGVSSGTEVKSDGVTVDFMLLSGKVANYLVDGIKFTYNGASHTNMKFPTSKNGDETFAMLSDVLAVEEYVRSFEETIRSLETKVILQNQVLLQSGIIYTANDVEVWNERVTANGLNVLDGSKAVLKKVVGSTVACRNLVDIPFINEAMAQQQFTVNFVQDIFVSVGELATVAASAWRFAFTQKNGEVIYVFDIELERGGKKISATADNPIVKFAYRSDYITAGQYSKIMIEYGDTATEYQPYFTGLKSASFGGIESGGKNLWDAPYFNTNTKYEYFQDNTNNLPISIIAGVLYSYTFSCKYPATEFNIILGFADGTTQQIALMFNNTKVSFSVKNNLLYMGSGTTTPYRTYESNIVKIGFRVYGKDTAGWTNNANEMQLQVEHGFTATEYTPYISPYLYAFPKTEMPLGKTIDFENKKITDYGVEVVFDGDTDAAFIKYTNKGITYNSVMFYNGLPATENRASGISTDGTVVGGTYGFEYWWLGINSSTIIWLGVLDSLGFTSGWTDKENPTDEEKATAIANFNAWLAQRYADGNPVKIRYVSSVLQSETDFTADNEYTAYKGGTEKVLENDGKDYGADNEMTINYVFVSEVQQ